MSWIKERREKTEQLEEYANQLEKAHQEALDELASIAAGFVLNEQPSGWQVSWKLQDRAAKFLARRKMPTAKRPFYIW